MMTVFTASLFVMTFAALFLATVYERKHHWRFQAHAWSAVLPKTHEVLEKRNHAEMSFVRWSRFHRVAILLCGWSVIFTVTSGTFLFRAENAVPRVGLAAAMAWITIAMTLPQQRLYGK